MNNDILPVLNQIRTDLTTISNSGEYELSEDLLRYLGEVAKEIEAEFGPEIAACYKAHKAAIAKRDVYEKPRAEAEAHLKGAMKSWTISERSRLIREEQERQEKIRLDLLAAAQNELDPEKRDRLENEAFEKRIEPQAPTPTGGSRQVYLASVVDIKAFCKGVVDGIIPVEAVGVNQVVLNSAARTFKLALNWPGVEVKEDISIRRKS